MRTALLLQEARRIDDRPHIGGRVLVATCESSAQGVDDDEREVCSGSLSDLPRGSCDVFDRISLAEVVDTTHDREWKVVNVMPDAEGDCAPLDQLGALQCQIQDGAWFDAPSEPVPAGGDVQSHVLHQHRLAVARPAIDRRGLPDSKQIADEPFLVTNVAELAEQPEWMDATDTPVEQRIAETFDVCFWRSIFLGAALPNRPSAVREPRPSN